MPITNFLEKIDNRAWSMRIDDSLSDIETKMLEIIYSLDELQELEIAHKVDSQYDHCRAILPAMLEEFRALIATV
jgi:hypothetical protein